nr:hypothetical protein JUJ52_09465 [Virgibacillus sp. AGTR]
MVEPVGKYDFLINGELNHFDVTISDVSEDDQTLSVNESNEVNVYKGDE